MYDNQADRPFHSAREHTAIERRTQREPRQNGGPAREQRAAVQQKLRRHLAPIWKGLKSGHDPEGQKGAACSEVPIFGREFNCISTRRKIKLAEQQSVQLTQSAASLVVIGLAKSYLAPHSESFAIPAVRV